MTILLIPFILSKSILGPTARQGDTWMTKTLRYILVGTGGWGATWCDRFLPRLAEMNKAVPVAAVDKDPRALENARTHLGLAAEKCYTDMDRAFADNRADFAIVVVPPDHHEEVVDAALAHDLDILSEKPIADTMEASIRILDKVRSAGKKMAVNMTHRFDQDKQTLETRIKSGDYGRLNYLIYRFTHNCRKYGEMGGFRHDMPDPLLIDAAVHHFEVLRSLSGGDGQTIYAVTWNPPWGEYAGDTTGLVTLQMTNGVRCFYEGAEANASSLNGWAQDYIRAECENGTLELNRRELRLWRGGAWEKPLAQDLRLLKLKVWMGAWVAEMFCDWLLGGEPPPTRVEDNIQCSALVFAAIESARTGRPVDVQEFLQKGRALPT